VTLQIWHIPKRSSMYQIVGVLNIIKHLNLHNKLWTESNIRKLNKALATWGFSRKGISLSSTARETLEALLKYLGLIYVDENRIMNITPAGFRLIRELPYSRPPKKRKLKETVKTLGEISSRVIDTQMLKLTITNPVTKRYCSDILLAPFRETIYLLLDNEIQYLTKEELAYIVFSMKHTNQRNVIKHKILHFRNIPTEKREEILRHFKETEIGNKTLVQAPTASYWMNHCVNTSFCIKNKDALRIEPCHKSTLRVLLKNFNDNIFDFANDMKLWIEYIGNPARLNTPFYMTITFNNIVQDLFVQICQNGNALYEYVISSEKAKVKFPVFEKENYSIRVFSFCDGSLAYKESFVASEKKMIYLSKKKGAKRAKETMGNIKTRILELLDPESRLDKEYENRIDIVKKLKGRDKFNLNILRGGRLEFLFYRLLECLKEKGTIAGVKWMGHLNDYGIAIPAPGGKTGNPDIIFFLNGDLGILEITTIPGITVQWDKEGSSVIDHIKQIASRNKDKKGVFGIFSAPTIYYRVEEMFKHISSEIGIPIKTMKITKLLNILTTSTKETLKKNLLE